jgi:hypothetical protein
MCPIESASSTNQGKPKAKCAAIQESVQTILYRYPREDANNRSSALNATQPSTSQSEQQVASAIISKPAFQTVMRNAKLQQQLLRNIAQLSTVKVAQGFFQYLAKGVLGKVQYNMAFWLLQQHTSMQSAQSAHLHNCSQKHNHKCNQV